MKYLDILTAFDIETSATPGIDDFSHLYHWQWRFGVEDGVTVFGRTWRDLRGFIAMLLAAIPEGCTLVILVHNLSYEFSFLPTIYDFRPDEVFALRPHKVAKCTMYDKRLEFRCSYIHSNMSLAEYTRKMGVEHGKLTMDHGIVRYPWTPLTAEEQAYCEADVQGLVEAYQIELNLMGDNLYTVPLTSTGYVRRDVKRAMRKAGGWWIKNIQPSEEVYKLLRRAFRGGDTHANRYYVGSVVANVEGYDRSSSYPDVICNDLFPMTAFRQVKITDTRRILRERKRGYATLFRIIFHNMVLKDPYNGFPYLSVSKCNIRGAYAPDNGRILSADYCDTVLTDVDFLIVDREYTWDKAEIEVAYQSRYGKLPASLRETTIHYYVAKTSLKGVESERVFYEKSKNLLNSNYGLMAQDPVQTIVEYLNGIYKESHPDITGALEEYKRKAYLAYQWGVWLTATARLRLREGMYNVGLENVVYVDTDSVKYVGDHSWEEYNEIRRKASQKSGAYADDRHGETHYMGVYEQEGVYPKFKTLGAKKYVYTDSAGDLHITIAGVHKRKGVVELEAAGGIEAFREGFIFRDAGGTASVYNGWDKGPSRIIDVDGHSLEIGPNVHIKDSTYTVGLTTEYKDLLSDPSALFRVRKYIKTTL